MLLKFGVDISLLNREIRRTLAPVEEIFLKHGQEGVISSTYEGNHGPSSLHYANDAYDLRLPRYPGIIDEIREALGPDYDVVKEGTHIHIEYDPK